MLFQVDMTSQLLEFLRTHDEAFRSRNRLASLYSDFRYQRNTNPDGYQANSSAWLHALSSAALSGLIPAPPDGTRDRFVLHSGEQLLQELQTPEYGRPLALSAVVEDAVNQKAFISSTEFLETKQSVYHKSWIPTPRQVVGWGLRQVGLFQDTGGEAGKLVKGQFVLLGNVEDAARAVMESTGKLVSSNASRIFTTDQFSAACASAIGIDRLSPRDIAVLLRHLARDHSAIAYSAASGVVKLKAAGDAFPAPITDEDVSIAALRSLIASITPQIDQLTARIAQLDITARTAVSNKQLTAAKTALRRKKLADTRLQQRAATLAQLEDVYAKIEQAADQVEIVKVMQESSQTLKSLNKQIGSVEKVQDVMDGLREEMLNVDEIGQAINEISAGEIDEGEVEDELNALESIERRDQEKASREEQAKQEAAVRAEREEKETEEAEQTRQRLAELDSIRPVAERGDSSEASVSAYEHEKVAS